MMSTKHTCASISPPSILTPSTIQCTKFYSDASTSTAPKWLYHKQKRQRSFCDDMKKYLLDDVTTMKAVAAKEEDTVIVFSPPILLNRFSETYACLDDCLVRNIQQCLPCRISVSSKWSLVYSLDQHGASLNTLYNRASQKKGPCLLVIQDNNDEIFGAYLSEGIHISSTCYGTGECFLWRQNRHNQSVQIYAWTMLNDYLVYSDRDFLAVGGGQGRFGLWLHSDLTHGYTESCTTFNNPILSQAGPTFECLALEIWNFEY